jgi:small subunit ribosomal protein S4
MARYTGPRLKKVRRFQAPLPGLTQKNGERRPYPPGQHGPGRRSKLSDYRIRLEEKQKLRLNYGLSESQLRQYYRRSTKTKGDTGALLLQLLERRLDNCVFRAGFAPTIAAARQLVNHGHVRVNDAKVDIASFLLASGHKISLAEKAKKIPLVVSTIGSRPLELPSYLTVDAENFVATMTDLPSRPDTPVEVQELLIIELYSRVA